jgi:hypothetical protein
VHVPISLLSELRDTKTSVIYGFGGMQLKIEMSPEMAKIKIDFLI